MANLQWLCRLFLETREQLFAAHEGTPSEAAVCEGLREELDVVRFRRLLEDALSSPSDRRPLQAVVRLLRSFGRRVVHGRQRSAFGRRAHEQFVAACAGRSNGQAFVLHAVPRVLQLFDRLIKESCRGPGSPASAGSPGGQEDPWAETGGGGEAAAGDGSGGGAGGSGAGTSGGWEALDNILEEHRGGSLNQLHDEADDFLQQATDSSKPAPLQLPADNSRQEAGGSSPVGSGGRAPRGHASRKPTGVADSTTLPAECSTATIPRRLPAHAPFYSGDPVLLAKVAKAPLPNLDTLVATMTPGAELTTEGLLLQLADEELVMFAYALEQITEAASKRLVRELEARDELRSTCMHRREYLQLLEGALTARS